jgi:hypothetical protein
LIFFPPWSDLASASPAMRSAWEGEMGIREKYRRYFEGLIFTDRVPMEQGSDEDAPLLYPVGLNLVKMLCLAQTDSAFGEWEDNIISFEVTRDELADSDTKAAIELLNQIATTSSLNSMLWEVELDRNVYGGGVWKISPDLKKPGHVKWTHIPLEGFFPVWDPDDENELLECFAVSIMSAEQAKQAYGMDVSVPNGEIIQRVEHWTRFEYSNVINGIKIDAYSGINPWGFVPFVYVPRFRTSNWWGDAMTEDVMKAQDELNMRVADIGEALNYNAHPVRWGRNLPKSFNTRNYEMGPNALWDLGRTIGNSPPPEVGVLEAKNAVSDGAFQFVDFLYDWSRTSVFAPPIAFGEDSDSAPKGGPVLEIRMWPLIKYVRRTRAYMGEAIARAIRMSALILQQKHITGVPARALTAMVDGSVKPHFFDIMPRDHVAIVDEVIKLMSTTPPTISIETAQKILGRGSSEVDRISTMLKNKLFYPPEPMPSNKTKEALAGAETPQAQVED